MPRVLFVHHRPQASGAARSLATLISALTDDWEAHVLVPGGAAARLLAESGARVHTGPVPAFTHTWDVQYHGIRWLVAAREACWLPTHRRQLRRLITELRPALVHVNDVVMLASGSIASRSGVPVAWHLRSSLPYGGTDRRSHTITRFIDRHAATAVAIDRDVAATYKLHIPLDVIANPVVAEPGGPADLGVPAGRVSLGFFGYLRRQKGWPQFLDAIRALVDRGAPVHGVVVGGGVRDSSVFEGLRGRVYEAAGIPNEERDFSQRIAELGIGDRITWLPFTPDPGGVLRALDVVVFPNQGAGLGRPVLEAAAYGKPVVASGSPTGGGVLIPDVTGLLVGIADQASGCVDALERVVRDETLRARLGSGAAEHAALFAPARVAAEVERLWERVVEPRQ